LKTVVLSGYYGFNNAGDEALLAAIIQALRELRPDVRLVVLSASPQETQESHGVEAADRSCPFCVWGALRQADLLISGGGSLLQDVTSGRSVLYYLGVVVMALLLKKPVMFYAQGIGPIRRSWARRLTRAVADRVTLITVRDEDSRRELERLGVKRPPVMVTADPVLGMAGTVAVLHGERGKAAEKSPAKAESAPDSPQNLQRMQDVPGRSETGETEAAAGSGAGTQQEKAADCAVEGQKARRRIGFALREWKGLSGFKEAVRQTAERLAAEGWEVLFIPLHYPDDLNLAKEIAGRMSAPAEVLEGSAGRPLAAEKIMQTVAGLDVLVGMRLHSLIFAAAAGVPVLGISYDPKVDAFLEQLGEKPVARAEELTMEKLEAAVMFLVERLPQARQQLGQRTQRLRELAQENARLAVELLERTGRGTEGMAGAKADGTEETARQEKPAGEKETAAVAAAAGEKMACGQRLVGKKTTEAATAAGESRCGERLPAEGEKEKKENDNENDGGKREGPEDARLPAGEAASRAASEKEDRRVNILGVDVDRLTMPEALERIAAFIEASALAGEERLARIVFPADGQAGPGVPVPRHVVTLNAEMAYRACQDAKLREVLKQADLVTPDGAGVVWAGRVLGGAVPERVTGIDLVHFLMPLAAAQGWRVFLLGGAPGVAREAAQRLAERFPGLCIAGTHHGYFERGSAEEETVLAMIGQSAPHILLAGMGSPRQEYWIREQIDAGRLKVPVSIGVGGSLDVIAGRLRRAPAWMQKWRLEWLWRLVQQPSRWRRMLALPAFAVNVWRQAQRQQHREKERKSG